VVGCPTVDLRPPIDGVERPLTIGTDGPREWRGGLVVKCDGLGVVFEPVMESLVLGMLGVMKGFGVEVSERGGDGGVGASDALDEVDFVGGVAKVGEEVVVAGDSSDKGDWGRPGPRGVGFRFPL
jgi:hypothetical protein